MTMLDALSLLATLLAVAGIGQALAGWLAVRRFAGERDLPAGTQPALTLLKPLYGDEPLLEAALASVCQQDYADYQIVFGVQNEQDPAIAVVERLQQRFPERDITLVVNAAQHGTNRKVSNLINMFQFAKHDLLVIADSDLHCAPDYLSRVVAAFAPAGIGLVTTLYAGLAANASLAAQLGACSINHGLLPGALLSRGLGRQDCLGATMALQRSTLQRIGGLHALVDHLADDNVLGQRVRQLGLRVGIATTVPATTVPEHRMGALYRHELRWSRTIQSLVPVAFALSSLQFPLFWALLSYGVSRSPWAFLLFLVAWAARALVSADIDRTLGLSRAGLATPVNAVLLPLRDILSITIILASYLSDTVEWRGQMMHTRPIDPSITELPRDLSRDPSRLAATQGTVLS